MKNVFLGFILVLLSIEVFGQITNNNLDKYFYDLPIDSCHYHIKSRIKTAIFFDSESETDNRYIINKEFLKNGEYADSAVLQITCFEVAIGGSPDQISPMVYEQTLTNTIYFPRVVEAEILFKTLKSELDTFGEPYLYGKSKFEEWVYSLETNIGNIQSKQIHLVFDAEAKEVTIHYRKIHYANVCNCP